MAKTRRKKINKSPARPFRNSRAFVVNKGDMVTTIGVRGRTLVKRVTDETGRRLTSVRVTEDLPQTKAKTVGERKPVAIFVGRQYTGVGRGKAYPYRSTKRGAPVEPAPVGLMGGLRKAARAVKKVIVQDAAE